MNRSVELVCHSQCFCPRSKPRLRRIGNLFAQPRVIGGKACQGNFVAKRIVRSGVEGVNDVSLRDSRLAGNNFQEKDAGICRRSQDNEDVPLIFEPRQPASEDSRGCLEGGALRKVPAEVYSCNAIWTDERRRAASTIDMFCANENWKYSGRGQTRGRGRKRNLMTLYFQTRDGVVVNKLL